MDYPIVLLPSTNHKTIDCDLSEFCLVRHSHLDNDNILNENSSLKDEVIQSKELPDLSTSLYGVFTIEHTKLRVVNPAFQDYCVPNYDSDTPVYNSDFVLVPNRGYWTIPIVSINQQEVNYSDEEFSATCHVIHTPMKWNFWHFSIRWFIEDIDDFWHNKPEYQTKSIRRKLSFEIKSLLKEFGKPIVQLDKCIASDCYLN